MCEEKASTLTEAWQMSQITRTKSSCTGHWPKMLISRRGSLMQASLSCKSLGEWLLDEVGVALVELVDAAGLGLSASMSSTSCV